MVRRLVDETIQYITPDGIVVTLHSPPSRTVLHYEGDGLPDLEYSTTRGPNQHGFTPLGANEPLREINTVLRWNACSRDEYWRLRHEFGNYLRPNRTDMNNPSPGVLRRVLSNGEVFDLDCFVTQGPAFKRASGWDEFSFQDAVTFTAFNPILYNPDDITANLIDFTPDDIDDIVYGFVFEFTFADDDPYVARSYNVTYDGNWESYPIFTIEGPWTHILIGNQETGKKIEIDGYSSPALEITTIDLTFNVKTILTDSNVDLGRYVTTDSNLGTFAIQPDPLVAGGVNTIAVAITGGSAATSVDMAYKNRYVVI